MSEPLADDGCKIAVAQLFALINKQRKAQNLPPIEDSAIAARCALRFNLATKKSLDFERENIVLDGEDIQALEAMINDQFACYFDGDIERLCAKRPRRVEVPQPSVTAPAMPEPTAAEEAGGDGMMSKFKRLFGKDRKE